MKTSRNPGLDTLRALAIVLVMLHHYVLFVTGDSTFGPIGDVGWIGVDLFFALSGYLIGNQIFAALKSPNGLPLGSFYARRLLRTLPNFYVVLAIYALWPWFRDGLELPPLWRFLTFTQNIELMPGTAFSHAWSLCIEEQFYLVLPALALLLRPGRRLWAALAAIVIAGLVARAVVWRDVVDGAANPGRNYFQFIYYASLCRLDELVAGVALALLKNQHAGAWRRITAHGNLALALGVALLVGTCWFFLDDRLAFGITVVGYPLLGLACALLLIAALSEGSLLRNIAVPGAQSLALWSYAVYLTHKQVAILGGKLLGERGIEPDSLLAIAILMGASVLSGWLLYVLVETPFMRLRERYFPLSRVDHHRLGSARVEEGQHSA